MLYKDSFAIMLLTLSLSALSGFASAEETAIPGNPSEILAVGASGTELALTAFDGKFEAVFPKKSFTSSSSLEITEIQEKMDLPWRLDKLSKIYQFDIKDKRPFQNTPIKIRLSYETASDRYKKIYFFDKNKDAWRPLPSIDQPSKKRIEALLHLPFARLAVFADPDILAIGTASWYGYKKGDYAASPDFPKGSILRVYNLKNGKHVDVEVNDYGPERDRFPDRVVDLEKTAFAKIASIRSGLAEVRIEYLGHKDKKLKKIIKPLEQGIEPAKLSLNSKSAIVLNENTGEILFDKNSSSTQSLASLTKLVAVKVFLDLKPTLSRVVPYDTQDEKYNFAYVDHSWQSARVKLKAGEKVSIEDLIYSALVGSANNAVESLVRVSGMDRQSFIKNMNAAVAGWGATSTRFVEPTGLSPQNVSSPFDYAIITKAVFMHPIIQKASTMQKYTFSTRDSGRKFTIKNTNSLIEAKKFVITGSKTGYLDEAGYCLMTRAMAPSGEQIIAVTFGTDTKTSSFAETKNLLLYGLRKLDSKLEI